LESTFFYIYEYLNLAILTSFVGVYFWPADKTILIFVGRAML